MAAKGGETRGSAATRCQNSSARAECFAPYFAQLKHAVNQHENDRKHGAKRFISPVVSRN
jgi:hypothetical protein